MNQTRQSPPLDRPIAAFDFDGTLTVRDSFNGFLLWRVTRRGLAGRAAREIPALFRYLRDRDRGALKAAVARAVLGDLTATHIADEAEAYAAAVFDRLIRPDALAAWRAHRAAGDLIVIVTASPEITVAPFARRLGADRLIGTRLAFDPAGRLTGALDGCNCRGAEKVRRLREAFGVELKLAAAYGDTVGDREMLAIAHHPGYRVFTARPE